MDKNKNGAQDTQPPDLEAQARKLLANEDLMRSYWEQGHGHLWALTWRSVTSAVGRWLIAAVASGIGAAVIVYGVQHGWWK